MTTSQSDQTLAAWITRLVEDTCNSPENSLYGTGGERAWAQPLVGFCRGDDPIYKAYKKHVGPQHWTPLEIFQQTFPEVDVDSEELTVIAWVLPQTEQTKLDNRRETVYPAERWARSRIFGEQFNDYLKRQVADTLTAEGYEAVAPGISPLWERTDHERFVYASTWSERHAAYASGLGTFGLCDGLITPKGKAMRVGSVVARLQVPPTPRPYSDHHAYCLFYAQNTCGECMARCPVGAITEDGHDKIKCSQHLGRTREYVPERFGFAGYGCGLCQTGVPCESGIPEGIES
jgi:hypothetical protein